MLLSAPERTARVKATSLIDQGIDVARRNGMRAEVARLGAAALKARAEARAEAAGVVGVDSVAESVEPDRPDLSNAAAPDGTVTIMFSDVEGSTVLTEQLGDEGWLELFRRHNSVIRRQPAAHTGFEVKSQGDGFMVAFASARNALRCAISIQRDLQRPAIRPAARPCGCGSASTPERSFASRRTSSGIT